MKVQIFEPFETIQKDEETEMRDCCEPEDLAPVEGIEENALKFCRYCGRRWIKTHIGYLAETPWPLLIHGSFTAKEEKGAEASIKAEGGK